MRLVFLDSGPLGLLTNPRGRSKPDRCRQWVKDLAAAQALMAAGPTDSVTVATDNIAHLSRFVDARLWETITA